MNELFKEKMMTVKEVAEALNVSKELILKRIKELFPYKMQHGKTTYLNEQEVTAISIRIKENSSLATVHDRNKLSNSPKTQLEKKLIIKQAFDFLVEEVEELKIENIELKSELQLYKAPIKTQRAELNQIIKNHAYNQNMQYGSIWHSLYTEFLYRYNINTKVDNNNERF